MTNPKMLFLDIETAPSKAYVWSIWQQDIGLHKLIEPGYLLSWAAKWRGSKKLMFDAEWLSGRKGVAESIWKLLNEADIVVHFNGKRFDMPTLNQEFLLHGIPPPAPYKNVDLYLVAKRRFKLLSYKLAYITKILGMKGKVKVDFQLWVDCMAGKPEAWAKMEKYNKRDVTELEAVYNKLLPWIDMHPNLQAYAAGLVVCPNCGGKHIHSRGKQVAKTQVYQRFQCQDCGAWLRSRYADKEQSKKVTLVQIGADQ